MITALIIFPQNILHITKREAFIRPQVNDLQATSEIIKFHLKQLHAGNDRRASYRESDTNRERGAPGHTRWSMATGTEPTGIEPSLRGHQGGRWRRASGVLRHHHSSVERARQQASARGSQHRALLLLPWRDLTWWPSSSHLQNATTRGGGRFNHSSTSTPEWKGTRAYEHSDWSDNEQNPRISPWSRRGPAFPVQTVRERVAAAVGPSIATGSRAPLQVLHGPAGRRPPVGQSGHLMNLLKRLPPHSGLLSLPIIVASFLLVETIDCWRPFSLIN